MPDDLRADLRQNLGPYTRPIDCPDAEWQMRVELAAAYRLIHHFNWTDQIYNHITARVPGTDGRHEILINPYGLSYDEVCASNLVKIDLDGTVLDGSDYPINQAGYTIHSAIHGARDDLVCVLHTHSRAGVAVSCLEEGFMAMTQGGFQFYNRLAYHDYEGIALDLSERDRLVADLGTHHSMILKNHGVITGAGSVARAFSRLYYLEQACEVQLDVLKTGRKIVMPSAEVCEHTAQQWDSNDAGAGSDEPVPEWPAYLRMLDRIDPSYRD
jgi:ribulose-5-phosphate 4-epimerase/fuculose-1-phosphate aldolase